MAYTGSSKEDVENRIKKLTQKFEKAVRLGDPAEPPTEQNSKIQTYNDKVLRTIIYLIGQLSIQIDSNTELLKLVLSANQAKMEGLQEQQKSVLLIYQSKMETLNEQATKHLTEIALIHAKYLAELTKFVDKFTSTATSSGPSVTISRPSQPEFGWTQNLSTSPLWFKKPRKNKGKKKEND